MAEYIEAKEVLKTLNYLVNDCPDKEEFYNRVFEEVDAMPAADVAPKSEVDELQECIYDLYAMLCEIIYRARNNDFSALRPFRGASGCDAYQGAPPICRKFDKVFDKHEEAIYKAVKFAELKKKYTEENK